MQFLIYEMNILLLLGCVKFLYRNNLKNRNLTRSRRRFWCLERATIAGRQGASEDPKYAAMPTTSKTDSSGCFGINTLGINRAIWYAKNILPNGWWKGFRQMNITNVRFNFSCESSKGSGTNTNSVGTGVMCTVTLQ